MKISKVLAPKPGVKNDWFLRFLDRLNYSSQFKFFNRKKYFKRDLENRPDNLYIFL